MKFGHTQLSRGLLIIVFSLQITSTLADAISVTASVDRNRISFGESFNYTINVEGTTSGVNPVNLRVDGLRFQGPSTQTRYTMVNGVNSQSLQLTYNVTAARIGEYTIPGITVAVGDVEYLTQPIRITVQKGAVQTDWGKMIYGKIYLPTERLYIGQTVQVEFEIFSQQNVPLKGFAGFQCPENDLGFRYLENLEPSVRDIDGERFTVYRLTGSLNPTTAGVFTLGPCVIKPQITVQNKSRRRQGIWADDPFFGDMFGRVEIREIPIIIDAVSIEVLPLPDKGRPNDFGGAVGQWNLEVTAKPTEVSLGDPITLTVKISGEGNIDTVPMPSLNGLDAFKTYDPSANTTNNTLRTTGSRELQQVLIPQDPSATELPEVRLVFFDPIAGEYKSTVQEPIQIAIKNVEGIEPSIVSAGNRVRRDEKIGKDIVYLKGNLGSAHEEIPLHHTSTFWILNISPVLSLLGFIGWKRRKERLSSDVAYARRSRAAKRARSALTSASNYEDIQKSLQQYLGDRCNLPISGITAEIVDDYLVPRGISNELASKVRECFIACDNARFAGGGDNGDQRISTQTQVEEIIDALEKEQF